MNNICHLFIAKHKQTKWLAGQWYGNYGIEYGRCQNGVQWKTSRMEWKAIFHNQFHTSFHGIVFTEKIYPNVTWWQIILSQRYSTSTSTGIICWQIAVVWWCILQRWQQIRIGPGSYCFFLGPGSSFIRKCGSGSDFCWLLSNSLLMFVKIFVKMYKV